MPRRRVVAFWEVHVGVPVYGNHHEDAGLDRGWGSRDDILGCQASGLGESPKALNPKTP